MKNITLVEEDVTLFRQTPSSHMAQYRRMAKPRHICTIKPVSPGLDPLAGDFALPAPSTHSGRLFHRDTGAIAPPVTHSLDLENDALHQHQTMSKRLDV